MMMITNPKPLDGGDSNADLLAGCHDVDVYVDFDVQWPAFKFFHVPRRDGFCIRIQEFFIDDTPDIFSLASNCFIP